MTLAPAERPVEPLTSPNTGTPRKLAHGPTEGPARAIPAALPHTCGCGKRWAGFRTCHCAAECHKTYSGVVAFGAHRRGGHCLDPVMLGMVPDPRRSYECWGNRDEVVPDGAVAGG